MFRKLASNSTEHVSRRMRMFALMIHPFFSTIWFMGCTHFHGHCSRSLQFGAPFDVDELASLHELLCDQTLKLNSLPAQEIHSQLPLINNYFQSNRLLRFSFEVSLIGFVSGSLISTSEAQSVALQTMLSCENFWFRFCQPNPPHICHRETALFLLISNVVPPSA